MGLNTAAIILNDRLHDLDAPDTGKQIQTAIQHGSHGDGRTRCGVTVLPSEHADYIQIVAVGGNTIRRLGHGGYRDDDETLLRRLADQMGFRVVKKAGAKAA